MDAHEVRIDDLEADVAVDVTSLETDVAAHESRLDTLETDVATHESRIDSLEVDVDAETTRLGIHPSDYIDNRIAGLTANDSTKLIYSTQDHATPTYVRSSTCWGADLDLTCVSPWNSGNAHLWAGTAITPRHIVLANHAFVVNGSTVRFITSAGTVVTRTLSSSMQVGSTDIRIGLLDSDLPSTITPAKLLPDNWSDWITAYRTAVCYTDQEEKLLVYDLSLLTSTTVTLTAPIDTQRLAFYELPISGDSGNPVFIIIRGETVLLGTFYTPSSFPTLIGDYRAGVLSAISTLGAYGHTPEDVTMGPSIDVAAVRNNAESIKFTTSGSPVATGKIPGYHVFSKSKKIAGYSLSVDAGTATAKFWKIASGTAVPTVANVINTSGVSIGSGTHYKQFTVSDFTTTDITAGDILACALTAASGVGEITVTLEVTNP